MRLDFCLIHVQAIFFFSEWNEMSVGGTSVDMLILAHLRTCSKSRVASSTLWYRAVSSVVSVIVTDIVSVYTM